MNEVITEVIIAIATSLNVIAAYLSNRALVKTDDYMNEIRSLQDSIGDLRNLFTDVSDKIDGLYDELEVQTRRRRKRRQSGTIRSEQDE